MTRTQRSRATFPVPPGSLPTLKSKMLNWCSRFGIFLYLDSNGYEQPHGRYELLAAAGSLELIAVGEGEDGLARLQNLHDGCGDWLFGHLSYDLKNSLEPRLCSSGANRLAFPELGFFRPAVVCGLEQAGSEIFVESIGSDAQAIWRQILETAAEPGGEFPLLQFERRESREEYLETVGQLKEHIRDGDCYEINYCCEGFASGVSPAAPETIFAALNRLSPAPFAACYRWDDSWLMCASPERFLQKRERTLLSQPIKGTAGRGRSAADDEALKQALLSSEKERAENVMIVDLVRNDLARSCEPGSVQVEELFGIRTYPQVHQMVSTVAGTAREGLPVTDAIRNAFPMGSMTGAPKVKVMELIEQYERSRRGLYSGAVGYIRPDGDFDFNVVIRSLQYNTASGYLSYHTGGAITWDSDPAAEWEEMRLKGWAMQRIFATNHDASGNH